MNAPGGNRRGPLRITIITPAAPGSRTGNRVTALRWAAFLREGGHRVTVSVEEHGRPCDLMIALHARRSFPSISRFRQAHPHTPLVLALTGTDLYGDIQKDPDAQQALELADALVLLQARGVDELPQRMKGKARVIYQSVQAPQTLPPKIRRGFEVAVVGHLRPVKDPFLTERALGALPAHSQIRVVHIGRALEEAMAGEARQKTAVNPRYRWLGGMPRGACLRRMARSHLLVLSSLSEGGANVISEAVVCGLPVLASRVPGNVGMLGDDYPGYFPVGDHVALAALMSRAEEEPAFLKDLLAHAKKLAPHFSPATEKEALLRLARDMTPAPAGARAS